MEVTETEIEEKLEEAVQFYHKIRQMLIPNSIHELTESELDFGAKLLGLATYGGKKKKEDKQRLVSFEAYYRAMGDWESAMVRLLITDAGDVMTAGLRALPATFKKILDGWRERGFWREAKTIVAQGVIWTLFAKQALKFGGIAAMLKTVAITEKESHKIIERLRAKALPAPKGSRVRRRKVTRL